MNNMYSRMYGAKKDVPVQKKQEPLDFKSASRQIGGLKAQNATSMVVEVNDKLVEIPRMEYVTALEKQNKDMSKSINEMKAQIIKLQNMIFKLANNV